MSTASPSEQLDEIGTRNGPTVSLIVREALSERLAVVERRHCLTLKALEQSIRDAS